MAYLTKDQIKAARDLPVETVEVPEWGGTVGVRLMTAGEHTRLGVEYKDVPADKVAFYILAKTLVDESGAPLFDDAEAVEVLSAKSKDAVTRIYKVVERVNRLRVSDVEDAAKN